MASNNDQATSAPGPSGDVQRRQSSRGASELATSSTGTQVAHTLTACTRCRQRKTRCDTGLPRCGPCERASAVCEYYDSAKGHNVSRSYVVYLQHRVRELEQELQRVETEDVNEDPEAMMRPATVRMHEAKESKFLGPSSGIAITRLVMQLAKQFTDAKSIKDIVPPLRAWQIKELYNQEQAKPTSKIYPLISNVAAVELPNRRPLCDGLVQLYKLKVQPMYPALHEPSLDRDIDALYALGRDATPYQQFVGRMVIAISLQKMDTQYAGLADSYYLAALQHLEPVVKPMDLRTLQCFALMAEYSLLTPTRTAIYYVVGLAVRLAQALGLSEEKTIVRTNADGKVDYLEIDMRRRLFWCIVVMDYGLAHSLGRPAMMATAQDHIDVGWFATCDDQYITPEGIDPNAQPTLKKWIAIHFFKMRMLQLEIRRMLYLRKRPSPRTDKDPWFVEMHQKMIEWRDEAPEGDQSLDKVWFIGRYNTMIVFLYRPSPQVPRPSLEAALECFDACEYNIYMQREQISKRNVDLTWIFTQSIFMTVNTILWALSYDEVRRRHSRESVEQHLAVAMEAIQLASERWPGVASAAYLYQNLIGAILQIYDKNGDVPISATTPSDQASPSTYGELGSRSQATSPTTASTASVATPQETRVGSFSHIQQPRLNVEQPPPIPYQSNYSSPYTSPSTGLPQGDVAPPITPPALPSAYNPYQELGHATQAQQQHPPHLITQPQQPQVPYFDPFHQYNPLPEFEGPGIVPGWNTSANLRMARGPQVQSQSIFDSVAQNSAANYSNPVFNPSNPAYPFPGMIEHQNQMQHRLVDPMVQQDWDMDANAFGIGLSQSQQEELMQSLETDGLHDIQSILAATATAVGSKPTEPPLSF